MPFIRGFWNERKFQSRYTTCLTVSEINCDTPFVCHSPPRPRRKRFDDRRVNMVNRRREFFFVSPSEVRDALIKLDGHVLEFNETPDDEEYRLSEAARLQSLPPAAI